MSSSTHLAGNAPEDVKAATAFKWDNWLGGPGAPGFGREARQGQRFTTLNIKEEYLPGGQKRRTAETIHEVTVTEDCLNGIGFLHGGCTAYWIDSCSSIALSALDSPDESTLPSVSLNLSVTYHAPAPLGAKLRLISNVVAFSARVQTVRCEVWDVSEPIHKIVASATHIKMRRVGKSAMDTQAAHWREERYSGRRLERSAPSIEKAKL